jgi:hypothetical protein
MIFTARFFARLAQVITDTISQSKGPFQCRAIHNMDFKAIVFSQHILGFP